jgi:hypothetical protein
MHCFLALRWSNNTPLAVELLVVPNDNMKPEDAIECVDEDDVGDVKT